MLLFRRTHILVFLAALFAAGPTAVVAQTVTVTVNGQPMYLNPGPIERSGRVFVPLRGIFERLGAAVVYSSGTINATKGSTTVSLQIGSTQATVNGQAQILDVAPFIVGASTYVPLRFVAQSLGAQVGYDASTRVVAIVGASGPGPARPYPPGPPPPPNPPPNSVVNLRARQPASDSVVNDRFIVISAEFTHRVAPGSVRVRLDGNSITYRSGVSQTGFSYKPPAPLDFGSHTVRVDGRDVGGAPFDRAWSFSVRRSGQAPITLTINQPAPDAAVGRMFVIAGSTVPYARINVTAGATPSLNGQFTGTTTAGGQGNFRIKVTLTTLMGQQSVRVRITATDPSTSQSTQTTLQLRLNN
ncbi:MAG TPA: copper amine oxidase N-terminal domain-containing protein [Candidatus Cybelea sp.]